LHINIKTFMHKQAIKHKQAIIGGGYLFTENACCLCDLGRFGTIGLCFMFCVDEVCLDVYVEFDFGVVCCFAGFVFMGCVVFYRGRLIFFVAVLLIDW